MTARGRSPRGEDASRRKFVKLVAAGSAALLARPALAAAAARTRRKPAGAPAAKPAPAAPPSPAQKEFERQRAGTLATLKTIREFSLPPGGDLPVVFRPRRTPKRGR